MIFCYFTPSFSIAIIKLTYFMLKLFTHLKVVDDQKLTSFVTSWGKIFAMDVAFVPNTSKDDLSGKDSPKNAHFK